MKIEVIYIPCYKLDFRLTRICVASIRYWYPNIPIVLIKDLKSGNFNSTELEKKFNVSVFPQNAKSYGWGFSKFEVFFQKEKKRFLMLDSDIIFIGPILEILEQYEDDWLVNSELYSHEFMLKYYFNPEKIKLIDPEFNIPNFTFNTGQFVGTTDTFKREEFSRFIEWKEPRIQLFREAFTFGGEQPLLNYMLMKKADRGEITLRRLDFMREGLHPETQLVNIERIISRQGYPFLIHWHDKKIQLFDPSLSKISRQDILLFFEDFYYKVAGVGEIRKFIRKQVNYLANKVEMKLLNLKYKYIRNQKK